MVIKLGLQFNHCSLIMKLIYDIGKSVFVFMNLFSTMKCLDIIHYHFCSMLIPLFVLQDYSTMVKGNKSSFTCGIDLFTFTVVFDHYLLVYSYGPFLAVKM